MKKLTFAILVISAVLFANSCSEERGQVILVISAINPTSDPFGDVLDSEGIIPPDTIEIDMLNQYKNPDGLDANAFSDIILDTITVSFNRIDGGSDSPGTYRSKVTYRVPAAGSLTIDNFTVIPATMKAQFPIGDLIYYGYERSTNFTSIKYDLIIELSGKTLEGDPVFAKGSISIELADWAD